MTNNYYGPCADGCLLGRGHSGRCETLTPQPGPRPSCVASPQTAIAYARDQLAQSMRERAALYMVAHPDRLPSDVYRSRAKWLQDVADEIVRGSL